MAGEEEYTRFENDLQARLDVVGAQLSDVHAKFRAAVQRRDRVELALLDQERTIKELEKRRLAGMLLAVKQQHCDMRLSTYTKARAPPRPRRPRRSRCPPAGSFVGPPAGLCDAHQEPRKSQGPRERQGGRSSAEDGREQARPPAVAARDRRRYRACPC